MIREAPNINHLWSALIVEELVRLGGDHFFVAPGSRSTPLVTAVGRHERTTAIVHYDERGTAFAALGYARATGKPAVWITTSGTAVANGLPAVIEAHMDNVPLILITADRPPELRQTGANQTINQANIFGSYLKWSFEGAAPSLDISPAYVLTSVDQAVHRAIWRDKGPVHLNWMFREPLVPISMNIDLSDYLAEISEWIDTGSPFTTYSGADVREVFFDTEEVINTIFGSKKGLITIGRLGSMKEVASVCKVVQHLKWPVYADVASSLRLGGTSYLNSPPLSSLLFRPKEGTFHSELDVVIQFGKRSTSKKLNNWIRDSRPKQYILVDSFAGRIDPMHNVTHRIEGSVSSFCTMLVEYDHPESPDNEWVNEWHKANKDVNDGLSSYFNDQKELSEPMVARIISECIGKEDGLVLGNSMPVRDMNEFAVSDSNWVFTVTNRGASGIDGAVGIAAGFAIGYKKPVTILLGDLSLLHDLNSLALGRQVTTPLVIVVINNDGGGIFSFLPIAAYEDVFEPFFGTPHGLSFSAAAGMFGYTYHNPTSCAEFRKMYSMAIQTKGLTLIEVNTERGQNRKLHQDIEGFLVARRQ